MQTIVRNGTSTNRLRIATKDGEIFLRCHNTNRMTPAVAIELANALVDHAENLEKENN